MAQVNPNTNVVRTRPRVDLHHLALYTVAGPAERRQILLQEKYPSSFRMTYTHARVLAAESLRLDWDAEVLFGVAADRWCRSLPETYLAALKRLQSIDAVVRFAGMMDRIKATLRDLDNAVLKFCRKTWTPLVVAGVPVHVVPDGLLVDDEHCQGLLSLRFSRTRPHTERSATIAAALLADFSAENLDVSADSLCVVVDAYADTIVDGTIGNWREEVHAAAAEIAETWGNV